MIEERLATRRRYDRAEAAQVLNIKEAWLKRWVTARCIPHQRSGNPNRKLPDLMTERQAERAATTDAGPADLGAPEPVSAAVVEEWATLGLR